MLVLVLGKNLDAHLGMLSRLPAGTRIVTGETVQAVSPAAGDADVILSWFADGSLLEEVLKRAPRVRWIHSSSAGLDTVLSPGVVASPAVLTNARGVYSDALGEFAVAGMLFFAKGLRRMLRSQADGRWDPFDVEMLKGKVLGIAGYGSIGRATAGRARPFGMRIFALRRTADARVEDGVEQTYAAPDRDRMLAKSDYVLVAAPLTAETRGLIGEAEFGAMKREAVLINLGRGPVVDEPALIRALQTRRIRGAVLDVFEQEPLPPGHPFFSLDNVLLSPHCADHTAGWLDQSMELFLENFAHFAKGEPLRNVVDKARGY